uniref:Basic proline-rich protein-like n=1 Tax=Castor canadensis TaxID=51338 RepID=A0A8B7WJS2_CASCN
MKAATDAVRTRGVRDRPRRDPSCGANRPGRPPELGPPRSDALGECGQPLPRCSVPPNGRSTGPRPPRPHGVTMRAGVRPSPFRTSGAHGARQLPEGVRLAGTNATETPPRRGPRSPTRPRAAPGPADPTVLSPARAAGPRHPPPPGRAAGGTKARNHTPPPHGGARASAAPPTSGTRGQAAAQARSPRPGSRPPRGGRRGAGSAAGGAGRDGGGLTCRVRREHERLRESSRAAAAAVPRATLRAAIWSPAVPPPARPPWAPIGPQAFESSPALAIGPGRGASAPPPPAAPCRAEAGCALRLISAAQAPAQPPARALPPSPSRRGADEALGRGGPARNRDREKSCEENSDPARRPLEPRSRPGRARSVVPAAQSPARRLGAPLSPNLLWIAPFPPQAVSV